MAKKKSARGGATNPKTPAIPVHLPSQPPKPTHRLLRGYAFDPSLATQLETALVSEITYKVPWEKLKAGPIGEYLEVVDYDPPSACFYAPVDLDHPSVLAQNGLAPVRGQPAVPPADGLCGGDDDHRPLRARARAQGALGGPVRKTAAPISRQTSSCSVCASIRMRCAWPNAYYSRNKAALLFGYFPAHRRSDLRPVSGRHGVHLPVARRRRARDDPRAAGRFSRALHGATNPDVLAFHEAFADIVALFQHFTFPEVLSHQIAKTRGDLAQRESARPSWRLSSATPAARTAPCATRSASTIPRRRSGSSTSPIPPSWTTPWRCTRAAPFWWPPCSTPSCRSIQPLARPAAACERRHRRACRRESCIPTS